MKKKAKTGDRVSVHYRGTLDQGIEFDSTYARGEPFSFTVGDGQAVVGFEKAVCEMDPGEKKVITITPDQGFGEHHEDLLVTVPIDKLPEGFVAEPGTVFEMTFGEDTLLATVVEIKEGGVLIDANHPLAGVDLTFELELVGIE